MNEDITVYLNEKKQMIDKRLPAYVEGLKAPETLKEAMIYSLGAGGKRLRPILLLAVIEAFGQDSEKGMNTAIALEMVHTYSLIHDDLPAMDNDDLRRGKPTSHKVFGEAGAILAGDALLTFAFGCIAESSQDNVNAWTKLALITKLASAAGPEGMVGGQHDDLTAEGKALAIDQLESIHQRKTGHLLMFAVEAGALLAEANDEQINHLLGFAEHLGLAFQIRDDILDIEGNEEDLGKPVGSDVANQKNTYPKLLTMSGAKKKMIRHIDQSLSFLAATNLQSDRLEQIAAYILKRNQ